MTQPKNCPDPQPIPSTSTPRDAGAPFNDPTADVTLRSSDSVDFHVHKLILSLGSPFFRDMFSIPQPTSGSDFSVVGEEAACLPVVDVTEDARTLETLLRCCYPVVWPTLTQLSDVRLVLEAAQKYDLDAAYTLAVTSLKACIDQDVLGVFAIACRCKLNDICVAAATQYLQHKLVTLDSEELDHISARQYRKLLQYHQRCATAASAVFTSRNWLVNADPQFIFNRKPEYSCSSCSVQDTTIAGSDYHASPEVWKYLERAREALRDRPHPSIPLLGEVLEPWPFRPCAKQCSNVDNYGRRKTQVQSCGCVTKDKVSKALVKEINRVLNGVEVPSFC